MAYASVYHGCGTSARPFALSRASRFYTTQYFKVNTGTSTTKEIGGFNLNLATDSAYLAGTDITYSGGRGTNIFKLGGTYTGTSGAFSSIYSAITTSGTIATAGAGVIGIKQVVTNTGAITDGSIYGAQFIAKHNHATNAMAAEAALIGVESWAYVSAAGCANTVIGANVGWHNEATSGDYAAGSVTRGLQVFCDNNAGGNNPDESTGVCIWNQAGTITNAINVVESGDGFTYFLKTPAAGTKASGDMILARHADCTAGYGLAIDMGGTPAWFMITTDTPAD